MEEFQEFRGHASSVLCCAVDDTSGNILLTGAEDGLILLFDARSASAIAQVRLPGVTQAQCVAFHPLHPHRFFVSFANSTLEVDLKGTLEQAIKHAYAHNEDEVNATAVNAKGTHLVAADDTGCISVVDLHSHRQSRCLGRAPGLGHTNICSSVAFRRHRPWELLTGGLDSRALLWDFSSGKVKHTWDLASEAVVDGAQMLNPPLVHGLAVPQTGDRPWCGLMALATGDGSVSVYDVDAAVSAAAPPATPNRGGRGRRKRGAAAPPRGREVAPPASGPAEGQPEASSSASGSTPPDLVPVGANGRLSRLAPGGGAHTRAATSIQFLPTAPHSVLSGGDDERLILWRWLDDWEKGGLEDCTDVGMRTVHSVRHGRKVNQLIVGPKGERAFVADVGHTLKSYLIRGG